MADEEVLADEPTELELLTVDFEFPETEGE